MTTILLIDDDRTNSNLIRMILEMDGFTVNVSPDLEQARQLIDSETAAFIIDCNLAKGDNGMDILREVREGVTAVPASTPVIMTSGDDRREKEATASGATKFLLKPYSPNILSEELTKLIGN